MGAVQLVEFFHVEFLSKRLTFPAPHAIIYLNI